MTQSNASLPAEQATPLVTRYEHRLPDTVQIVGLGNVIAFRVNIGGQNIVVHPSIDGRHVFIQVDDELENNVIAIPAGAAPWLVWALSNLKAAQ